MKKRILATILSICMIISLFPASAFAVESVPEVNETDEIMLLAEDEVNEVFAAANSTGSPLYIIGNPSRAAVVTLAYDGAPNSWTNPGYVTPGTPIKLTLTLAEGFLVDTILLNDSTEGIQRNTDGTYSFEMPSGDRTVVDITFKKTERTVKVDGTSTENKADVAVTPIDTDMTSWPRNPGKAYFGDTVTITTNPKTGEYKVPDDGVTVTYGDNQTVDVVKSAENKYTFTMPDADVNVKVNFKQIHNITGVDKTSGKATPKTSTAIEGDTVTLDVVASTGYTIKSVKYKYTDATGENTQNATPDETNPSIYTFTMPNANVEILAEFLGDYRKVTVNQPSDSATVGTIAVSSDSGDDTWNATDTMMRAGSIGVVTGTPQTGYILGSVTVTRTGNTPVTATKSETNPNVYTFEMPTEPINVTASFRLPKLTVTVNAPSGASNITKTVKVDSSEVNPDSNTTNEYSISSDKTPELSVTVPSGYIVTNLTVNEEEQKLTSDDNLTFTQSLSMTTDCDVVVTVAKLYELTFGSSSNGTVTSNIDANTSSQYFAAAGADIVIAAVPNSGYEVDTFKVVKKDTTTEEVDVGATEVPSQGTSTDNKNYKFKMPEQDITVNVTFKAKPFTLTVEYKDITGKLMTTDSTKEAVTHPETFIVGANVDVIPSKYAKDTAGNYYILATTNPLVVTTPATGVTLPSPDSDGKYAFTSMPAESVVLTATYTQAKVSVTTGTGESATTDYYTDINTAVTEAQKKTSPVTITLLDNCTFNPALKFTTVGTYTLDLNGKELTSHTNKKDGYGVSARGRDKDNKVNLTIKDSVGGGSISNCMTNVEADRYSVINIGVKDDDKDFTIKVDRGQNTGSYSPLKVEELGEMNIFSGTIDKVVNNNGDINTRSIQSFGKTTIEGGTFEGVVQVWEWVDTQNDIQYTNSELTINGGEFKDSVVVCSTEDKDTGNLGEVFGGDLVINGGTFNGNADTFIGLWVPDWVDAGELTGNNDAATSDKRAAVKVEIKGGTFNLPDADQIGIFQHSKTEGESGIVSNPTTPVFTIKNPDDATKTGPVFSARPGDSYIAPELAATLTPNKDGKYTITDGYEVSVMDGDKAYEPKIMNGSEVANKETASKFTVTLSASAGTGTTPVTSETGLMKVPTGTTVTMAISKVDAGYEIGEVTGATATTTTTAGTTYTVNAPATGANKVKVKVTCNAIDYTITEAEVKDTVETAKTIGTVKVSKVNGATPSVDATTKKPVANAGQTVTLTVEPAIGKQLVEGSLHVTYKEEGATADTPVTVTKVNATTYTFKMPAAHVTVAANFGQANYTLEVAEKEYMGADAAPGDGSALGNVEVYLDNADDPETDLDNLNIHNGSELSVKVTPEPGYTVKSVNFKARVYAEVLDKLTPIDFDKALEANANDPGTYSISMKNDVVKADSGKDITITVTYEKIQYTVATEVKTNGVAGDTGGSVVVAVDNTNKTNDITATIGQTVKFTVTKQSNYEIKTGSMQLVVTDEAGNITETKNLTEDDLNNNVYTVKLEAGTGKILGNLKFSVEFVTKHSVTVSQNNEGGTVSFNGQTPQDIKTAAATLNNIQCGTSVSITFTPPTGSTVKSVTGLPADATRTDNTFTFNMPARDLTLSVNYMTPVTLTRIGTIPANEPGEVVVQFTEDGDTNAQEPEEDSNHAYTVAKDSEVKIIVTPKAGYELNELAYNNQTYNPSTTGKSEFSIDTTTGVATLTISNYQGADGSNEFSVTFKAKAQPITLTAGANGTVEFSANVTETTDNGVKSYTAPTDAEVTITAKPIPGFELNGTIEVKNSSDAAVETTPVTTTDGSTQVKFTMPVGGVSITVNFKGKEFSIDKKFDSTKGAVKVLAKDTTTPEVTKAKTNTDLIVVVEPNSVCDVEVKISYDMTLDDGTPITATRRLTATDATKPNEYALKMPGYDITVEVTFTEKTFEDGIVASIGSVGYPTVKAAFDAAETGKEITIVLQDDSLKEEELFVENKTITLDLNGYTLSKTHGGYTISVSAGGKLTIKDSSASTSSRARTTGTGKIANGYEGDPTTTLQVCTGGELIIKSGTIENENHSGDCSAIKVEVGGKLSIADGTIGYGIPGSPTGLENRSIQSFGDVTIDGGTITGNIQVWGNQKPSKLTINDGTFQDDIVICGTPAYTFDCDVVINNGTFTKENAMIGLRIPGPSMEDAKANAKMTINNGTFAAEQVGVYVVEAAGQAPVQERDSNLLEVTGGTFKAENPPIFSDITTGKVAVKNEQGAWVITEAVAEVTVGEETTRYASMKEAIDAVNASGVKQATIKLLNNINSDTALPVIKGEGKDITLDLNGKRMTKTHSSYTLAVEGKAQLTIEDKVGGGVIANDYTGGASSTLRSNGGTLIINGGTITNGLKPDCSAVKVDEDSKLVINGGIIKNSASGGINDRSIQTFGNTEINGGTIEGVIQVWQWRNKIGGTTYPSNLTINGGTFNNSVVICSATKTNTDSQGRYVFGGNVTIESGNFTNPEAMIGVRIPNWGGDLGDYTISAPKMTINGGTFAAQQVGVYQMTVNEEGKTVVVDADEQYKYLEITGGSFSAKTLDENDIPADKEAVQGADGKWTIQDKTAATYTITVAENSKDYINVVPATAEEGATVAVILLSSPENQVLDQIKIDYTLNDEAKTDTVTGTTFTMPAANVIVSATFKAKPADPIYVAQIGKTQYETIDAAFKAAIDSKQLTTITLLDNAKAEGHLTIENGTKITLNLNGHQLSKTHDWYTIDVNNGGELTIIDTVGTGVIDNDYTGGPSSTLRANNGGKLTINGGTILNKQKENSSAVKVDENGTLVINEGATIGSSGGEGINDRSIQSFGTTTIKGGTIEGVVQVWQWRDKNADGTYTDVYPSTLTIENGTFNDSVVICSASDTSDTRNQFGGELVINGGTFNDNDAKDAMVGVRVPAWGDNLAANTKAPKMTINGGKFDVKTGVYDVAASKYLTEDSDYLNVTGGNFKERPSDVAEGMIVEQDSDGRFIVKKEDPGVEYYTIKVSEGINNGNVTTNPTEAVAGTYVVVTAEPDEGYMVTEISYSPVNSAEQYKVAIVGGGFHMPADDVTVSATFEKIPTVEPTKYGIIIIENPKATVTVDPTSQEAGKTVNVTVTAKEGCVLTEPAITVTKADGSEVTATKVENGKYTFEMPEEPVAVHANAEDIGADERTITVSDAENGEVITVPGNKATVGDDVAFIATPDEGYKLEKVAYTIEGSDADPVEVTNTNPFKMPAGNITVTATFTKVEEPAKPEYDIAVLNNDKNGNVSVNIKKAVAGTEVPVTATANEDYKLVEIIVTAVNGTEVTVTDGKFTMPACGVVVSATFEAETTTEPKDPVKVEAGTPDASGNVNITISNVKSDKFYTVRVANSEDMDKESVIFVLSGKMADPDTHTLTFQVKAGNKFIMVAETAEQPVLGKDNPFMDKDAVVDETTISGTETN